MSLDRSPMGADRGVNPRGMRARVGDMLAALERVAGPEARARVRRAPDPAVAAIVGGWPAAFTAERARTRLGFSEQEPLDELVRAFIEDDLEETRAERGL
ncbi:MAG: hypothetical protein ICV73_10310 [Acetobacteraceae bacterium]|nr:hypothetical protein [Acetobacteraceae bacterium]